MSPLPRILSNHRLADPRIRRKYRSIAAIFGAFALSCSVEGVDDSGLGGGAQSGGSPGDLASGGTAAASGGTSPTGGGSTSGGSVGSGGEFASGGSGPTSAGGNEASAGGTAPGSGGELVGVGGSVDEPIDAAELVTELGFGTNIGNTLENTTIWETGWGQPLISQAFIQGIASRGIKTVRVPVAWDTYANAGVIAADKMQRVQEVVAWIEAAGMYAIVNIHWDGGWLFNEGAQDAYTLTAGVKSKFTSYWQQIASAFAGVGHKLIFEGLNEEARYYIGGDSSGQPDYAALNEINQLFVTTVRAEAGYSATRALLIAGFHTDIALTCVDAFTVPNDPAGPGKLFLSLHYYTPYTFCGLDTVESWGSPTTTWGTDQEKAELTSLFDQAANFSESRSIPIILGEFGVTPGENYPRESASRTLWMDSVTQASLARGIVPVLWDTGSEISRTDGSFSADFQPVMDKVNAD